MRFSNQVITVQPPIGGINRRVGYQQQPPYTTYDCQNFWPTRAETGRVILATRPRLEEQLPAPAAFTGIYGLETVNGLASANHPARSMVCNAGGTIYYWTGSAWVAATGAAASSAPTSGQTGMQTFLQKVYIQPASTTSTPIVFDYDAGALDATLMAGAFPPPDGLTMFAVWQGALWAAGAPLTPGVLYASRVGDADDWDFSAPITDTGGAFFTAGENEGLLRGDVRAIIPHTTDILLVCTVEGIVAIYGHPRQGGIIEDFSDHVCVGKDAWCKGPDNATYILTQDGLIKIPPQSGVPPVLVSDPKIPDELQFNAYEGQPVNMAYDVVHGGFHISRGILTTDDYWWFDEGNGGGFFRMALQNGRAPNVMLENPPFNQATQSSVAYGTDNGIFVMEVGGTENFTAECYIGPIALAPNLMKQGKVQQAAIVFGELEPTMVGQIDFTVASSAIDCLSRSLDDEPQFVVDLAELAVGSRLMYPKVTGNSLVIHVSQTSGDFSLDQMVLTVTPAGNNNMVRYVPPGGGSPPAPTT
jgi:hypothetical protein